MYYRQRGFGRSGRGGGGCSPTKRQKYNGRKSGATSYEQQQQQHYDYWQLLPVELRLLILHYSTPPDRRGVLHLVSKEWDQLLCRERTGLLLHVKRHVAPSPPEAGNKEDEEDGETIISTTKQTKRKSHPPKDPLEEELEGMTTEELKALIEEQEELLSYHVVQPQLAAVVSGVLTKSPRLTHLKITGLLNHRELSAIFAAVQALQHFHQQPHSDSDAVDVQLPFRLQHLDLSQVCDPALDKVEFFSSTESLEMIPSTFPLLKSLDLGGVMAYDYHYWPNYNTTTVDATVAPTTTAGWSAGFSNVGWVNLDSMLVRFFGDDETSSLSFVPFPLERLRVSNARLSHQGATALHRAADLQSLHLRSLAFDAGVNVEEWFSLLLDKLVHLQHLGLADSQQFGELLLAGSSNYKAACCRLKGLDVSGCPLTPSSVLNLTTANFACLQELNLSQVSLSNLQMLFVAHHLPRLQDLSLGSSHKMGHCCFSLLRCLPRLHRLKLVYFTLDPTRSTIVLTNLSERTATPLIERHKTWLHSTLKRSSLQSSTTNTNIAEVKHDDQTPLLLEFHEPHQASRIIQELNGKRLEGADGPVDVEMEFFLLDSGKNDGAGGDISSCLHELKLEACKDFRAAPLLELAALAPLLRKLTIKKSWVTEQALHAFTKHLPSLQKLDVRPSSSFGGAHIIIAEEAEQDL
ncbi:hypothetical protein QOT17_001202 [Balamuthia mandrillaris]